MASRVTPQLAAVHTAATSSGMATSSRAIAWGDMARSSIGTARALGQPSSTSVRQPTSSWGRPRWTAASSPRSSTRATRQGGASSVPWLSSRTRSRSSVVFPPPGGLSTSVLRGRPSSSSSGRTGRAASSRTRGMRIARELTSRMPSLRSPQGSAVPHTPMRKPPSAVT